MGINGTGQIRNTSYSISCAWPEGTSIQGGRVLREGEDGLQHDLHFVEVSTPPHGYFRAEAPTMAAAEQAAFARYQLSAQCPGHEWQARGYTNGAGFCRHCGVFGSNVLTGEQLGQHCHTCGVGTTYGQYSTHAYWDAQRFQVINPGPREEWAFFCAEHAPCRAEFAAYMFRIRHAFDDSTEEEIQESIGAVIAGITAAGQAPDDGAAPAPDVTSQT